MTPSTVRSTRGAASKRRLSRLFAPDGRMLIVAFDHTVVRRDVVPGLEHYPEAVEQVRGGAPDAYMVGIGTLKHAPELFGSAAVVVTPDPWSASEDCVEQALRVGADALKVYAFPFSGDDSVARLSAIAATADRYGLPLIAEPFPGGFKADDMRTPDIIAAAARLCAEAGADVVKSLYAGDPEGMRTVVEYAGVPVIVLGGAQRDDPSELLAMVRSCMEVGCAGAAIGKNVFAAADPAAVTRDLMQEIHGADGA